MIVKTPRKNASAAQSATSLPLAPADDAGDRVRNYLITMGIRIVCLCLAAFVTPHSWYTFVFAAGAIFLPYFAVVGANAASGRHVADAVRLDAPAIDAARPAEPDADAPAAPTVITIAESPAPRPEPAPPVGDEARDGGADDTGPADPDRA